MAEKSVYADFKEAGKDRVKSLIRTVDSRIGEHWAKSRSIVLKKLESKVKDRAERVINFNWKLLRYISTTASGTFTVVMSGLTVYNLLNVTPADISLYLQLTSGNVPMFIGSLYSYVHSLVLDPGTMFNVLNYGSGIASVAYATQYLQGALAGFLVTPTIYYSNKVFNGVTTGSVSVASAILHPRTTIRSAEARVEGFLRKVNDHMPKNEIVTKGTLAVIEATSMVIGSIFFAQGGAFLFGLGAGAAIDTTISVGEFYLRKE